jgi:hypothetical protein
LSKRFSWFSQRCTPAERRLAAVFRIDVMILWVWMIAFAIYAMQPLSDPDTPWHLATGQFILSHHQVPTTDPFSWTMRGEPWITQEWLFEAVFAWLVMQFQFIGAWLLYAGIHALTVFVLYRLALGASKGHRLLAAVLAVVGTIGGMEFWTLRPQIASYFFFALFLLILQAVRQGRFVWLWFAPFLLWLWANTHGSASIGVLTLLLEAAISFVPSVGRFQQVKLPRGARWRLVLAAITGTCLGFVNPNGVKAFTYALLSTNPLMVNNIMEWHSPDFHTSFFKYGILPFLIIVFLVLLGRRPVQLPWREVLFFGGSFAMTLVYQRFMPYLAVAAVPLLAAVLQDVFRSWIKPYRLMVCLNAIVMIGATVLLATRLPQLKGDIDAHFSQTAYPVDAVTYIQHHHIGPRILNSYQWGGYLIYRGVPTFVDGRTDIFLNQDVFANYLALENIWWNCPDLLTQYHIDAVIFPQGSSLVTYLESQSDWKVSYSDNVAVVLTHTGQTH